MDSVVAPDHNHVASELRNLLAKHEDIEFLVKMGEYQRGSDPEADRALELNPAIRSFLRQKLDEGVALDETIRLMKGLMGRGAGAQNSS